MTASEVIPYVGIATIILGVVTVGGVAIICIFLNRIEENSPSPRRSGPCSEIEKQRDYWQREAIRLQKELERKNTPHGNGE